MEPEQQKLKCEQYGHSELLRNQTADREAQAGESARNSRAAIDCLNDT